MSLEQERNGARRSGLADVGDVWRWLAELTLALREGSYRPDSIKIVFIPKASGRLRPMGISTVRDRVCMTSVMLVLEPIFEAYVPSRTVREPPWEKRPKPLESAAFYTAHTRTGHQGGSSATHALDQLRRSFSSTSLATQNTPLFAVSSAKRLRSNVFCFRLLFRSRTQ